jgi:hypothetical protein
VEFLTIYLIGFNIHECRHYSPQWELWLSPYGTSIAAYNEKGRQAWGLVGLEL